MINQKEMKRILRNDLQIPSAVDQRISSTLSRIGASSGTVMYRRPRKMPSILIAAALILILFTGTAFAIYNFSLRDLEGPKVQIGTGRSTEQVYLDEQTPQITEVHTISLNGLMGSPEYEAAQEWESYVVEWYKEGTNMLPPGYVADESDMYIYCQAISQEAKDTLVAILDEYGLKMHNTLTSVHSLDDLYAGLGISGFMPTAGNNGEYPISGQYYDDGTFAFNCAATLHDNTDVRYQFYRFVKGTFTRVGNLIADVDDFEEWTYTTSRGNDVLLAIGTNKSIIAVNLDNSFVFVNILSGTENNDSAVSSYGEKPLDRYDLEAFAEGFDFLALSK